MKFKYSAKTQNGMVSKKGMIDAPDIRTAVSILKERGLIVYSLLPANKDYNIMNSIQEFMGVSLNDKVKFTEHLASMIVAGLPLTKALELLVFQTNKKKLNDILQDILNEVEAGSQLSRGMEKHPEAFDEAYISLVKAGEASGQLGQVLERLAITLEKERQFRTKIVGAMIYPAIVTIAMVGVFVIILVFVIPQMVTVYESFDVELPFSTRALIAMSNGIRTYWWLVIASLVGLFFGLKFIRSTKDGKYMLAKFYMMIPLIGSLIRQTNIVQFTRSLGLLVQSGVPIVDSLTIVRDSVGSILFKDSVSTFIEDVKHGYPLSQSITQDKNFPPLVSSMVVIGEETGTIYERLNSISEYYEGEVDKVVKNLSTAIEPLIMIVLGIMVGLLIVSVILPIYQLTTSF